MCFGGQWRHGQKAKFCSGVALQLRVALGLPAGEVKAVVLFNTAQRIFKKSETTTGIVSFDISAAPDNKLADREVYDYHLHVWLPKRANQPADQSGRPPFEHVVLRIGERKDFSQGDQVVAAAVKPTRRRSKADLKELTDAEHALAKADMQKQYRATQRLAACKARLESTDEVTFVLFRQPSLDAELGTFSTSISVSRADVVMLRSTAWKRQHPSTQTPLMAAMQHEGRQHGMLPIKRHCPEPVTCPGSVQQTLDTGECTQQSGGAAGLLFPDAACRVCGRPDEEARVDAVPCLERAVQRCGCHWLAA
ncbi:hypothetical protein WJX72_009925 [[Myrmecia] bisecta]|uniref:Uncharacterized protein n=1 Tax=[Myrmecia] bisecta TaxID=41462 RepID=A0AAW1P4P0_9CHLO